MLAIYCWGIFAIMAATNYLFYASGTDTTVVVQSLGNLMEPGFNISSRNVSMMYNLQTHDE